MENITGENMADICCEIELLATLGVNRFLAENYPKYIIEDN